jgi:large subunit ribosomal protein L9
MKILLCKDVEKLGWLGDVVEVKNGYARNYLLPQGLGTVPTDVNIRALSEEKAKRAEERKLVREQLERAVAAVEGAEAVIDSKANEQGHLYGSVSASEIAGNLREQGYEVSDDMVQLPEHIKEVGTHEVKLKLAPDLAATISVVVVSQDETIESIEHDNQ